ncbi:hypothetical protein AMTRI_Chr02g223160 [Amborella trichopoda]
MPRDPYERALLRFWANFFDSKLSGGTIFLTQGEEQEKAVAVFKEGLKTLENGLKNDFSSMKPFFNGQTPGYLRVVVGSNLGWIKFLEEISGAKLIDQENTPFLFSWLSDFCEFGVVKEALPDQARLVAVSKKKREMVFEMLFESTKHQ